MSPPSLKEAKHLVGADAGTVSLFEEIVRVARTRVPVLVLGDTGTGKEVVAKEIHAQSPRHERSFVAVNCAELTADMACSELFGHVRGAFTGADRDRKGLVRAADGGTLFLDEIADLPRRAQVVLLRVLEDGLVRPAGSDRSTPTSILVIAATNCNLTTRVKEGRFREDLLARFGRRFDLSPLRDRPDDIAPLALNFLCQIRCREGMNASATSIAPDALALLRRQSWPSNARGLRDAIEAALTLTYETGATELLPEHFVGLNAGTPRNDALHDTVERARAALEKAGSALIDAILNGSLEKAMIPDLLKRFPMLSPGRAIAAEFLRRFPSDDLEHRASAVFGYSDVEGVRRFTRPAARTEQGPSGPIATPGGDTGEP